MLEEPRLNISNRALLLLSLAPLVGLLAIFFMPAPGVVPFALMVAPCVMLFLLFCFFLP